MYFSYFRYRKNGKVYTVTSPRVLDPTVAMGHLIYAYIQLDKRAPALCSTSYLVKTTPIEFDAKHIETKYTDFMYCPSCKELAPTGYQCPLKIHNLCKGCSKCFAIAYAFGDNQCPVCNSS